MMSRQLFIAMSVAYAISGSVCAQDPLDGVLGAMDHGNRVLARRQLTRVILESVEEARFRILDRSRQSLLDRGDISLWLEGVHDAIELDPKDPMLRYMRGFVLTDLKFLRRAQEDLKVARRLDTMNPYYVEARMRLADRAFDYPAVVALAAEASTDLSKALLDRTRLIQQDLRSAKTRQVISLLSLVLLGALIFVLIRRAR